MQSVHIVIPDLFLPQQLAAYACADLHLPALEKILGRAKVEPLKIDTLEAWLCEYFGVNGMAVAPVTLQADGMLPAGAYWLRADPVSFSMERDQMIMQAEAALSEEEAAQLCASLNIHFAPDGMRFVAPHPQRWYLQLDHIPAMNTFPLPQVVGADMHAHLPFGEDALRWHSILNEIQMLFYEHEVNRAREQRGVAAVSGVWFWGGGKLTQTLRKSFVGVAGDSELAGAFAQAAGIPLLPNMGSVPDIQVEEGSDKLLVYESLRSALQSADIGRWRNAVLQFEKQYAEPLLELLAAGRIERLTLDVLSEGASRRLELSSAGLWKFWRRPKSLLQYALLRGAD
jgi:hypothetical protein